MTTDTTIATLDLLHESADRAYATMIELRAEVASCKRAKDHDGVIRARCELAACTQSYHATLDAIRAEADRLRSTTR